MNAARFKLFGDYLDYLQQRMGFPLYATSKKLELFQEAANSKCTRWIDIFDPKIKKEPIGFLIVGSAPNCHPNADFYFQEAYVREDHQGQGYMSTTVSDFIQANPGVYCLFVVKGNEPAYGFWKYLFAKNGYSPCYLSDVGAADAYCTQYGFRKRRNVDNASGNG